MDLRPSTESQPQHATIIGAGGFIGAALLKEVQSLGWSWSVPDRVDSWKPAEPLGHVFFCAGLTADYADRPADAVEAHACLLSRVLSSPNWESLVYLSSTRLYDSQPATRTGVEDGGFLVDPGNPRHLYDLSKLLGENLCRVMGHGKARVARLSCVYRDEKDPDGFLGDLMRKTLQAPLGSVVSLDSSPNFQRDYVHMDNVVEALIQIAVRGRSQVYNVACGSNVANSHLAETITRLTGVSVTFGRSESPPPAPVLQTSRLDREFGWNPKSVEQSLHAWAKEHGRLNGAWSA